MKAPNSDTKKNDLYKLLKMVIAPFLSISIALIIGIILGITVFQPHTVQTINRKSDENADAVYNYDENGNLLQVAADINKDGETDIVEHYSAGQIDMVEIDTDFDGYFETQTTYENSIMKMETVDYNQDEKPEKTSYFNKNGQIEKVEFYDQYTGRLLKISTYQNGRLHTSSLDSDMDGVLDTQHEYDEYENIISSNPFIQESP